MKGNEPGPKERKPMEKKEQGEQHGRSSYLLLGEAKNKIQKAWGVLGRQRRARRRARIPSGSETIGRDGERTPRVTLIARGGKSAS